jgi:hypothetical protein
MLLAINREEVLKWRGRTGIPVMSKGDGQQFKHEGTEMNSNVLRWSLRSYRVCSFIILG